MGTALCRNLTSFVAVTAGYRSGSGRMYQEGYGKIPQSGWSLVSVVEAAPESHTRSSCSSWHIPCASAKVPSTCASQSVGNFKHEFRSMRR